MQDDYKDIPTLDEVIKPGNFGSNRQVNIGDNTLDKTEPPSVTSLLNKMTDEPVIKNDRNLSGSQNNKPVAGSLPAENRQGERRTCDRRVEQQERHFDQIEHRIDQRRAKQRREQDKELSRTLDEMVDNIMQDMMPELEQHIRLKLRFEIEKYLPAANKQDIEQVSKWFSSLPDNAQLAV